MRCSLCILLIFAGLVAAFGAVTTNPVAPAGGYPIEAFATSNYVVGVKESGPSGRIRLLQLPFQPNWLTTNAAPFGTNIIWISPTDHAITNGSLITNALLVAKAGDTIWLNPGNYWIPTNHATLFKRGVNYHLAYGVHWAINTFNDDTTEGSRPVFDAVSVASSNSITGLGRITVSNRNSHAFNLEADGSRIFVQALSVQKASTNDGSKGVFFIGDQIDFNADIPDFVQHDGYDCFWFGSGSGTRFYAKVGRITAADTAIEAPTRFDLETPAVFDVGVIEKKAGRVTAGYVLSLGQNIIINAGLINLRTNSHILASMGEFTGGQAIQPAIINCPIIIKESNKSNDPDSDYVLRCMDVGSGGGNLRINNASIYGPTDKAISLAMISSFTSFSGDDGISRLELWNCQLIARHASTSNAVTVFEGGDGTEYLDFKGSVANVAIDNQVPRILNYAKYTLATNVNNTTALIGAVTEVYVRTFASSGDKDITLASGTKYTRGDTVFVKDAAGTASNNSSNIVVKSASGNIDGVAGSTGKQITTDYGAFLFWWDGTNWWSK